MAVEYADNPSVAVIGAGSWGTALAALLAGKLPQVTLWAREPEVVEGINQGHHNPVYLADLDLPPNLVAHQDLAWVAANHDVLVMVVPTQFCRQVLAQLKPHVRPHVTFVSATKGVETANLALISEIFTQTFAAPIAQRTCYLSGPSFAREVIAGQPVAVAMAGADEAALAAMQALFFFPHFRTYSTSDVVGVELGGALKNIIAIAAGISDGLGYGAGARAALITRGLAEIARLGHIYGANPQTFAGLSGMGDLLMTASSTLSRNYTTGFRLGQGESLSHISGSSREVAEGVQTAASTWLLAQRHGVEMPITQAVHAILFEQVPPQQAVTQLLNRDMKREAV
ncbi:glycerol 3-phosphate dehydrogenase (NAD(P)+) [Magnetococcus marinus MC-1]|uniref:Glycerol-3-phosphate dehydrogenase [NAD(P)+] n=1 Tax=Magnetococcus marinus (strain ATCC BAA-1437 / JCM 17883 / MC-1) TaxID=156889 RepID=A0L5L9_MAGMM|nr:NAD(P)H-dependent glycerol-3-phosphate dehydrogenase [Magnetococcus marinus]ABK43262.1 glycerol 3-phosphate dehydrogenase (NAD(P)+) [Magnetococcus marinus MC-1]